MSETETKPAEGAPGYRDASGPSNSLALQNGGRGKERGSFPVDSVKRLSAEDPQAGPSRNAIGVIIDSASEALGSAFLVWVLGGVAISFLGSFAGGMVPSLPPGFAAQQPSGGDHAAHPHALWRAVRGGAFIFFFTVFFVHSLWMGFHDEGGGVRGRIARIFSNLRENWFSLIVGNAISAWVAALVVGIVQNLSPVHMLWQWVGAMVLPAVRQLASFVLGTSNSASLGDWLSWYDANQNKLNFWIIYLGGAFDDLGVPNFKTLARWAWRRMQKRKEVPLPASSVGRSDAA